MRLSIGDHREKAAARMHIFLVRLQMLGQLIDALREDGDLHLRRTGILIVDSGFLDDLLLSRFR